MKCSKCGLEVEDFVPSAELNIRIFKDSEHTHKVFEYIKLCSMCAYIILKECRVV